MVVIFIWIVLILSGLGLLAMLVFGIRSLTFGKIKPMTMGIVLVPIILLVVLGFIVGDWPRAGILTVLITLAAAVLSLFVTGVKGLFT